MYVYIHTCKHAYVHGDFPEDLLSFPEKLPLLWSGRFQKTTPHLKILTKSQLIIDQKMGFSKADIKYFPEIAYSEQQTLCYHRFNLEQSPNIPCGESRRLEWGWEELGISL